MTPMTIYRSALISRRPDLTSEQFRRHWIDVHGSLASKLPGVGSYRQNHICERVFEALEPPVQAIDGISQLSFESVEDMVISDNSPEYAAVKADIPNMQSGITILVLRSHEVVAGAPGRRYPAKLLCVSTRRRDDADLQSRWLAAGTALAAIPGVSRLVQNFVIDRGHPVHAGVPAGDAGPVEALTELWFENDDGLRNSVDQVRVTFEGDTSLRPIALYRINEVYII